MQGTCERCKYGLSAQPGGQKARPGTVWCSKRTIHMGRARKLKCFASPVSVQGRQCHLCRWAKFVKPVGGTPEASNVWCDKRHFEINKLRKMECFEVR